MKKVLLGYDETTGYITDAEGSCVGTWLNVVSFPREEENKDSSTVVVRDKADRIAHLKQQGYELEDILKLKEAGLL